MANTSICHKESACSDPMFEYYYEKLSREVNACFIRLLRHISRIDSMDSVKFRGLRLTLITAQLRIHQPVKHRVSPAKDIGVWWSGARHIRPVGIQTNIKIIGLRLKPPPLASRPV